MVCDVGRSYWGGRVVRVKERRRERGKERMEIDEIGER